MAAPEQTARCDCGGAFVRIVWQGRPGLLCEACDAERLASLALHATKVPQETPHEQRDVADVADLPEGVGTDQLLEQVAAFIERYVRLPGEEELAAVALWVLHSWAIEGAHATPYLLVVSPEKRSGKTRLTEILELLVSRAWRVAAVSEAAMFRKIAQDRPTLLLDEIDAIFASASERTEPLRAILNSGNRPGASVARCVGDGANQQVVDFPIFCAKALAGIDSGRIPDTITDRAIEIRMRRKTDLEPVARFRHRDGDLEAEPLRQQIEAWAETHTAAMSVANPALPHELDDRAAEAWEPLFAIADLAGGDWPVRAREAAQGLGVERADERSHGTRVLAVARVAFNGSDALATRDLLVAVNGDDELPFGGWRDGKGLAPRGLAQILRPYGIASRSVRLTDGSTPKGYKREQFEDAWSRYLEKAPQAPQPPQPASQSGAGEDPIRHTADTESDTDG